MTETATFPIIDSNGFWHLYDRFCTTTEFEKLCRGEQTERCLQLQQTLREGHKRIVKLDRPTRNWNGPRAWLVLRGEMIHNTEGHVFMVLTGGDVMTREFGWDRDVFITHSPIIERVSGQFLGQSWPGATRGLFLPLFEYRTIMNAIETKLKANTEQTLAKAEEEARDWRWL